MSKPRVYLTTPVFYEVSDHPKVSEEKRKKIKSLWSELKKSVELKVSESRFPPESEIKENIKNWGANIVGCHLSHPIKKEYLEDSNVFAVCTSTAGFNHIDMVDGILLTHTPGVLHRTVADFTIAITLTTLRNLITLHNFVWNGNWKSGQKWDLDENLSMTMDNLTLGIVGMGEIGKELTRRLAPWGVKIIYYDIKRQVEFEQKYKNVDFRKELETIFKEADIVSLHLPLMPATRHIIDKRYLKLMKTDSLLVNTARGPVINSDDLLDLLEKKEISINLAFDVFEDEPIKEEDLSRYKKIAAENPNLRFTFIPHNASADADTRAEMAIMILEDILALSTSKNIEDIESIRLIPKQRSLLNSRSDESINIKSFKIQDFWNI